jgi:leucyl-tRNA synthetase
LQKDKTGVFIGTYAINPITNDKIPIYVADYVLNSYATGIVMGVPGHDQRDFDFAKKYNLPIKFIIETNDHTKANEADGKHIASPLINGLLNAQAQELLTSYLEKNHLGKRHISFKLKD